MNYPDNVDPADPDAPWNLKPATCARCREELDGDACLQGAGTGWPGELCSSCADSDLEYFGCSCGDTICSLACRSTLEIESAP